MEAETKATELISTIAAILKNGSDSTEAYNSVEKAIIKALRSTYRAGWIRANAMSYDERYFEQYNEQGYLNENL